MKRSINLGVFSAAMLLLPAAMSAQVSVYEFQQSVQTYTPITEADGGVSLGLPTWSSPFYNNRCWVNNPFNDPGGNGTNGYLGPAIGPGYPIGFPFTFNGDVFDVLGISNSGWISFGKSTDGLQAVWVYDISHPHGRPFVQYIGGPSVPYKRNRVAAWGNGSLYMRDMTPMVPPGPVTSLRVATIGTAPNRVCVVQFQDFLAAYPPSDSRVNFQIRLNESDNSVEVRYGQVLFNYLGADVQVGLGGRVPEDFNSRMTVYEQPAFLYDWNITVRGVLNTDACTAAPQQTGNPNGSGIPPVNGLTFKWTPPVCPPPAWPLTLSEVTFSSAMAHWPATPAGEYEFFVSTENSPTGPEATSGTTTDPEAVLEGLEPGTTYYLFVRSICGGEVGTWSAGTQFETFRGGVVECDGGVVTEDYCSVQYEVQEWLYISADGSPLRLEFIGGTVGSVSGESFGAWVNGAPSTGAATNSLSGNLAGQFVQASAGQIYLRLVTQAGACHAQDFYLPLQWRIGCKNCNDPLVSYTVGTIDCAEEEYYINADVFSMGSATSLVFENSMGLPSTTVNTNAVHAIGPFPAGETVTVTAQNPANVLCYSESPQLVNAPCVLPGCAPTWYERCGTPGDVREWLVQGVGQPISVRLAPANLGWGSRVIVYNGDNELTTELLNIPSSTNNQVATSSNPGNHLLIRYEASIYPDYACSEGNSELFRFVTECATACQAPVASFAYVACSAPTSFSVTVNITDLGSTGSVTITNDGGVADQVVTATGSYTVGPFTSGSSVQVNVVGASTLCSASSPIMTKDCTDMSVGSIEKGVVRLFPNPNDGKFQLELPTSFSGSGTLEVLDIAGRVVAQERLAGTGLVSMALELPNGLYTLLVKNQDKMFTGRVSIQH